MNSLWGTQLTDEWMANPWMFDPSQQSNQFSLFNNARLPFPPTYNEGAAGGPVNAATGQPIASYQAWKAANPGGMTINATPQQQQQQWQPRQGDPYNLTNIPGPMDAYDNFANLLSGGRMYAGLSPSQQNINNNIYAGPIGPMGQGQGGPTGGPAATPQGASGGQPNNWQAAINALANPGNPVTPGANVPLAQSYQPAGGVNQAFLQQAAGRPNMNQGFLSALRAIQGR